MNKAHINKTNYILHALYEFCSFAHINKFIFTNFLLKLIEPDYFSS